MLFHSLNFAIFFIVVFTVYWGLGTQKVKWQNVWLLCSSYFFYAFWDWRFLILILLSTSIDFLMGYLLPRYEAIWKRKGLLALSLIANLGILGCFKYYNFFISSFIEFFHMLGINLSVHSLQIVLPVGISFYTFQTLSYTLDVYHRKLKPSSDFIAFAGFVSFFPQLVAGPIERARNLLPQFLRNRKFEYVLAIDGIRQILWGLFKKVVVADNCGEMVDLIFRQQDALSGSTLLIGAIFFAFQIYGDFSGYSDMAIGMARLFGFELKQNFAFPYFSRNIAEFWRRWHISLSNWFRDYLYIPLGGSRGTKKQGIRNVIIIFLISGFWHGANWTFLFWGLLNALYFVPLFLRNKNRRYLEVVAKGRSLPKVQELVQILSTFALTLVGWIFFRSESVLAGFVYLKGIFNTSLFSWPVYAPIYVWIGIATMLFFEWIHRTEQHGLALDRLDLVRPLRWGIYLILAFSIAFFMGDPNPFIYFQF